MRQAFHKRGTPEPAAGRCKKERLAQALKANLKRRKGAAKKGRPVQ